jgi:hypothetical protein
MIRKSPPPGQGTSTALSKRTRFDDGDDQPELTVAIGSTGSGKQDKGALIRTVCVPLWLVQAIAYAVV